MSEGRGNRKTRLGDNATKPSVNVWGASTALGLVCTVAIYSSALEASPVSLSHKYTCRLHSGSFITVGLLGKHLGKSDSVMCGEVVSHQGDVSWKHPIPVAMATSVCCDSSVGMVFPLSQLRLFGNPKSVIYFHSIPFPAELITLGGRE